MFKKFMGKDEIQMNFEFNDDGFLSNINIEIMDKEFFKSFDKELNKIELDKLITNLFHNISSMIINQNQTKPIQQNPNINVKEVLDTKVCPRCQDNMIIDQACCSSLKQQGYAGVLKCNKCGYKVALKQEQLDQLNAN